jgi:hypothetical protein
MLGVKSPGAGYAVTHAYLVSLSSPKAWTVVLTGTWLDISAGTIRKTTNEGTKGFESNGFEESNAIGSPNWTFGLSVAPDSLVGVIESGTF